ncbi:hypothetical protein F5Y14DRAFT_322390 [Nemania sp. NC0429]|nr:hypothetical protein F5Y14DRAFT_322390 [Nemania sp. NC0429]
MQTDRGTVLQICHRSGIRPWARSHPTAREAQKTSFARTLQVTTHLHVTVLRPNVVTPSLVHQTEETQVTYISCLFRASIAMHRPKPTQLSQVGNVSGRYEVWDCRRNRPSLATRLGDMLTQSRSRCVVLCCVMVLCVFRQTLPLPFCFSFVPSPQSSEKIFSDLRAGARARARARAREPRSIFAGVVVCWCVASHPAVGQTYSQFPDRGVRLVCLSSPCL